MKKMIPLVLALCLLLCGCNAETRQKNSVVATTLPVYNFTSALCAGTDIAVNRLIKESVSCLHDYTLQVTQMRMLEKAQTVIISGAGLEAFMEDILDGKQVIDASAGVELLEEACHHEEHAGHEHEADAHIWMNPVNAQIMVQNICRGLCSLFPDQAQTVETNANAYIEKLRQLQHDGEEALKDLKYRDLITFHDGFRYFAQAFDLNIVRSIEEESGSEASANQLKELICMVDAYDLPAVFTEVNGSMSAASVVAAQTGVREYQLDMLMADGDYFDGMYRNIQAVKEALG